MEIPWKIGNPKFRQVHFHLFMVEDRKIGGMQPLQQHAPHCRLRQGMVMALGTGIKGRAFHDSFAGWFALFQVVCWFCRTEWRTYCTSFFCLQYWATSASDITWGQWTRVLNTCKLENCWSKFCLLQGDRSPVSIGCHWDGHDVRFARIPKKIDKKLMYHSEHTYIHNYTYIYIYIHVHKYIYIYVNSLFQFSRPLQLSKRMPHGAKPSNEGTALIRRPLNGWKASLSSKASWKRQKSCYNRNMMGILTRG